MPIETIQTLEVIEVMENFLSRNRPPEHIRNEVDIDYKIEGQSIIIFEIRPYWDQPENIMHRPVAKATLVKKQSIWKVFWRRADSKWHSYSPSPIVKKLIEFSQLVEEDEYGCFWG